MIFYVTKQTFERYKLKMPEDLSFPMNEIAKATLKKESGNRLLECGGKLFYFDKRKCIQFVNFASKLTIFVFDIKMDDLPMVGNYIANYLLDIYSNDKTMIKYLKRLFEEHPACCFSKLTDKSAISTPSNSYWTNLQMGNPVIKVPLPLSDIKVVILQKSKSVSSKILIPIEETSSNQNFEEIFINPLLFLKLEEKSSVLDALSSLGINKEDKLHPRIIQHDRKIKSWKQTHPLDSNASRKRDVYYRPPEGEPFLYRDVSELSLTRVYKILNALFKCIESLGGSVNEDLTFTIRNEIVRYKITEAEEKIPHVLTKEEQKAMEQYERERLTRTYAYKPNIRKWDYVFSGKLRFSVLDNKHYRDGENTLIEQRLPEILVDLYEESENVKIQRMAREAAARKAEEERKAKERRQEIYNEEVERVIALENEAEDYALACKIRAYVSAVEAQKNFDENTQRWVEWAKEKADWYDPLIAKEDELLGRRDHKSDKEQKQLKKRHSYFW